MKGKKVHLVTVFLLLVSFRLAMAVDVLRLRRIVPAEQSQVKDFHGMTSQTLKSKRIINAKAQTDCSQSLRKSHH